MLDEMTPEQFNEWMAYYTLEPFGDEWEQSAMVCATVFNTQVTKKHNLAKIEDYMPQFEVDGDPKDNRKMNVDEAQEFFQRKYGVG